MQVPTQLVKQFYVQCFLIVEPITNFWYGKVKEGTCIPLAVKFHLVWDPHRPIYGLEYP